MYHFSPRFSLRLTFAAAVCIAAASQVQAQAGFAAASTTSSLHNAIATQRSTWRDTVPAKLISAQVQDGVLTIDGMVAKVQLNYEIQRTGFLYFFVPGVGTAVVSLAPIPDAVKVKDAFSGSKLVFEADGHTFELSSKGNLLTRDRSKADGYVWLDRSTVAAGRYPRMGFGNTAGPYSWPVSTVSEKDRDEHQVAPPPLPRSVLQQTAFAETAAPAGASQANR